MTEATIADIEALKGYTLLEFGASWCPYCQNAQPYINAALKQYPDIKHIKIEDGKGKSLGRLFSVKLWPTLVILCNGKEVNRLIRPTDMGQMTQALDSVIS